MSRKVNMNFKARVIKDEQVRDTGIKGETYIKESENEIEKE